MTVQIGSEPLQRFGIRLALTREISVNLFLVCGISLITDQRSAKTLLPQFSLSASFHSAATRAVLI